jgi:MFS family permease
MSMLRRILLADWPAQDRNTLLGAALALFGSMFLVATWGMIILPVQQAFHASADGEVLLRQLPDIAGLLSVLAVGAFGRQVSSSRLMIFAAITAFVGAIFMLFAPAFGWLIVGLSLMSVGRSVVSVATFAAVGATICDESRRTSAFATLGAAAPVAFIVGPVVAGAMLGAGGWRLIGILWLVSALVLALAAWLMRTPVQPREPGERREPWTPILGGITLVGIVQSLSTVTMHGPGSLASMAWMGGTLAAGAGWFALTRMLANPTIDGRTLRVPGLVPILIVAMIGQCGDLWFYIGAFARFVHKLSALQGSLAMLVAQFASLAGACVAGWLIRRVGLRGSGALLLALYSAAMFTSCIVTSTSPLWILIGILSVAAVAEIGSGVCLSQAIMSCAPKDGERAVSSYRSAATGIGNALALLLVASSVSHAMGESMREEAVLRNTPADKVHVLVQAVRDNVPTSVIGRELDLSEERVQELRVARLEVIVDGFRAHGLVSGSVLAVAAAGFWLVRRDERPRAAAD